MTSGMSLVNAFYVMMVSLMLCIVMNIGLGFALDRMLLAFAAAGLYDVSVEWEPTYGIGMLCNEFYLLMYVPPLLGVANFVYTAVRRQRYDAYEPLEV